MSKYLVKSYQANNQTMLEWGCEHTWYTKSSNQPSIPFNGRKKESMGEKQLPSMRTFESTWYSKSNVWSLESPFSTSLSPSLCDFPIHGIMYVLSLQHFHVCYIGIRAWTKEEWQLIWHTCTWQVQWQSKWQCGSPNVCTWVWVQSFCVLSF